VEGGEKKKLKKRVNEFWAVSKSSPGQKKKEKEKKRKKNQPTKKGPPSSTQAFVWI